MRQNIVTKDEPLFDVHNDEQRFQLELSLRNLADLVHQEDYKADLNLIGSYAYRLIWRLVDTHSTINTELAKISK